MAEHWLRLTLTVPPILLEPMADFLVGILGAGVEEAAPGEMDYGVLHGYVALESAARKDQLQLVEQVEKHLRELATLLGTAPGKLQWEPLQEQDWSAAWKTHFTPFEMIPGLVVAPSWEPVTANEGQEVLVIDPGMAFGTGHHATTTLCLKLLLETRKEGQTPAPTLLDVGTGTGILAMAAVKLGACRHALGLDNDPEAVRIAGENIAINGLVEQVSIAATPLAAMTTEFVVVVANIVHDTLIALAPELVRVVAPGGRLVLSGLQGRRQQQSVVAEYQRRGLRLQKALEQEEWWALLLEKP